MSEDSNSTPALTPVEAPKKRRGRPRKNPESAPKTPRAPEALAKPNGAPAERRGPVPPGLDRELSLQTHLVSFIIACNRQSATEADREYTALITMLNACRLG